MLVTALGRGGETEAGLSIPAALMKEEGYLEVQGSQDPQSVGSLPGSLAMLPPFLLPKKILSGVSKEGLGSGAPHLLLVFFFFLLQDNPEAEKARSPGISW